MKDLTKIKTKPKYDFPISPPEFEPSPYEKALTLEDIPKIAKETPKAIVKGIWKEIKYHPLQTAVDTGSIFLSMIFPESLIISGPAKLLRLGKYIEYVKPAIDTISKFPMAKTVTRAMIEEAKTAAFVKAGEELAHRVLSEDITVAPFSDMYVNFLVGRGFFGALGKAYKAGFKGMKGAGKVIKVLNDTTLFKKTKLDKATEKIYRTFYKIRHGRTPEVIDAIGKIGNYNPELPTLGIKTFISEGLKKPEVKQEFSKFMDRFYKNISNILPKEFADELFGELAKQDELRSVPIAIFLELSQPSKTEFVNANREIWGPIKGVFAHIWKEGEEAFVDNKKNIAIGLQVDALLKRFAIKKKISEEKLIQRTKRFLEALNAPGFEASRYAILNYLFTPLLKEKKIISDVLYDFGIELTKKEITRLESKFFSNYLEGLTALAKEIVNKAKTISPIREKVVKIFTKDLSDFKGFLTKEIEPILREFYREYYIPRIGIKHYLGKLAKEPEKGFTDLVEPDVMGELNTTIPTYISFLAPFGALRKRIIPTLYDAFLESLRVFWRKAPEAWKTDPKTFAKHFLHEFGFTGGLHIASWIVNKFAIPKFLNELHYELPKILANKKIMEHFKDVYELVEPRYRWWKTPIQLPKDLAEAIWTRYLIQTGRWPRVFESEIFGSVRLASINTLWKRYFLWGAISFHTKVLTLANLALNYPKVKKTEILFRAYLDGIKALWRGYDNVEFAHMVGKIHDVYTQLIKKGHKLNELIISGWYGGEKTFAEYLATVRQYLLDELKKGDPLSFAKVLEDMEKVNPKDILKRLYHWSKIPERFLWAGFFQGLKIRWAYELIRKFEIGEITEEELVKQLNSLNNIFGGWHGWKLMDPNRGKILRLFLFAPDWYVCLYNNFRGWIAGESPLMDGFIPTLLRMRFYYASYLNYAINGKTPFDMYNLDDPKEWIRLFIKDWPNLLRVYFPFRDSKGHMRVGTIDLAGPETELFEMLLLLPTMRNIYYVFEHPHLSADQKMTILTLGPLKDWLHFWGRKGSMITRGFYHLYDATRRPEDKIYLTGEDWIHDIFSDFAPLVFVQWATLRYPYRMTSEIRNIFNAGRFMNMLSSKLYFSEKLTNLIFENRHRPDFLKTVIPEWFRIYDEINLEVMKYERVPKRRIQPSLQDFIKSLAHVYYKYYFTPFVEKQKDLPLDEILRKDYIIVTEMIEDVEKSGFPLEIKAALKKEIANPRNYINELRGIYERINRIKIAEEIGKSKKGR